ncbi:hypothetical protein DRN69_03350 [Candidatus Pacearchaeota archaeon]|nr:MAG: hypothetical protein DRN69_03350 [Candidatus Pacearchaeota archaeon]
MKKIINLTKEFLRQKYCLEELSLSKIAKITGYNRETIRQKLKKFNIPRRTRSEALKGEKHYMYGKHLPEITKKKISKANKGKHHSEVTKKKLSEIRKREKNPFYGKHHSKVTRKKMSEAHKGEKNNNWKGGRKKGSGGYIFIYSPNHPYNIYNYVYEHRLVVESQIGRYLTPKEVVHHINGVRDDNRPENLICFIDDSAHHRYHKNPNKVKPEEIIFDGRKLKRR